MQHNKRDTELEMTEEIACKLIKKVKKTKKISLLILGIGFVLILIGCLTNDSLANFGFLFMILGCGIGLFSTEGKKYKIAKKYISESKAISKKSTNAKKSSPGSKVTYQRNISDILSKNSEIRISVAPGDGRCGVAYFCDEYSIKNGIEKNKKFIEILSKNGFEVRGISLCGGVDELSHTGYASYRAEYENVEKFLSNALTDYVASEKEAAAEYGSWLSCYNFMYFSILFEKNDITVQVLYNANGETEIVRRDYKASDFKIIDELVAALTGDFYNHDCKVSAYCSGKNGSGYFEYPTDLLKFIK